MFATNNNATSNFAHRFASALRGFAYWLVTTGPFGLATGSILRGRAFDRLGRVATSRKARADTIGADEETKNDFANKLHNLGFNLAEAKHSVFAFLRPQQSQRRAQV